MRSHVSALILAGGKATRFGGVAKHELVVGGATIFARQVGVLAPRVAEIIVSSPRDIAGYRTVRDAVAGVGPLAGIAAGLRACHTEWLLVIAGDMPFVTGVLIERMIAHAVAPASDVSDVSDGGDGGGGGAPSAAGSTSGTRSAPDAVGVRNDGLPEPLLCVLHRGVLPIVERRIAAKRYKASGLLTDEGLRVVWIDHADRAALRNVNAPEDL